MVTSISPCSNFFSKGSCRTLALPLTTPGATGSPESSPSFASLLAIKISPLELKMVGQFLTFSVSFRTFFSSFINEIRSRILFFCAFVISSLVR